MLELGINSEENVLEQAMEEHSTYHLNGIGRLSSAFLGGMDPTRAVP